MQTDIVVNRPKAGGKVDSQRDSRQVGGTHTERQRQRRTDGWMGRRMDRQTDEWTGRWMDGQTDRWTDRWMDKQTDG